MIKPNDPAFPEINSYPGSGIVDGHDQQYTEIIQSGGLTIRAEFAKAAMQGLLSSSKSWHVKGRDVLAVSDYAQLAVEAADALIAELNKTA